MWVVVERRTGEAGRLLDKVVKAGRTESKKRSWRRLLLPIAVCNASHKLKSGSIKPGMGGRRGEEVVRVVVVVLEGRSLARRLLILQSLLRDPR